MEEQLKQFYSQLPPELQEKIQILPPEKQQEVLMQLLTKYNNSQQNVENNQQFAFGGKPKSNYDAVQESLANSMYSPDGKFFNNKQQYVDYQNFYYPKPLEDNLNQPVVNNYFIKKYKPRFINRFEDGGEAESIPVEAERNENITVQDGQEPQVDGGYLEQQSHNPVTGQTTYEIPDNGHSETHDNGGVNMQLSEGDVVNSDKTKIPIDFKVYGKNFKGKTFKDASDYLSKQETKIQDDFAEKVKEGKTDKVSEISLQIMLAKLGKNRDELNELQEQVLESKKQEEYNKSLKSGLAEYGKVVLEMNKAEKGFNTSLDRYLNYKITDRPVLKAADGLTASLEKFSKFADKVTSNPNSSLQDIMSAYKQSGLDFNPKDNTAYYKPTFQPINGSQIVGDFKSKIAQKETGAYKNPYIAIAGIGEKEASTHSFEELKSKAASSGIGKYQFIWNIHKNDIKRVTGISKPDDFRYNPQAQEQFMDWFRDNTLLPQATDLKQRYQLPMSIDQIMAMTHLEGKAGLEKKIKAGTLKTSTMANNFKNASPLDYASQFKNGGIIKKYPNGGKVEPIYTDNPKDKRLQAYNDSLSLYKIGEKNFNKKLDPFRQEKFITSSNKNIQGLKKHLGKILPKEILTKEMQEPYSTNTFGRYEKPVQPVIYKKKEEVKVPIPKKKFAFPDEQEGNEESYQAWRKTLPKNLQYEGDYDLKGFYKDNPNFKAEDKNQHLTDKYKLPNHPTFSVESKYYKEGMPAGKWEGDNYVPINRGNPLPDYLTQTVKTPNGMKIYKRKDTNSPWIEQYKNGGKVYAPSGVTVPKLGHAAINQFENTKGNPFGQSMQMGDNYSQSAEPKIIKFITDNIGEDTWNKMPPQLQTQVYSFAFNSKQDDRIFKGLATAINPNEVYKGQSDLDVARQNLDLPKALQMIRGADFSDPTIYNNYIDQILPQQYQSIADNYSGGFDKGQDIYNATWKNRATDIAKIFTDKTYEQNNPFSTWQGDKFTKSPAGYNTVPVNKADYSADDLLTVAKRLSPYSPISSNTQLQELIRDNYKKLTGKDITKIPFSTSNKDLIDGKFGDDWKDAISYFLKDQPDLSATDPELENFTVYANKPNPHILDRSKANSHVPSEEEEESSTSTTGQNKTSWLDKLKYGIRESLPYLRNLALMNEDTINPILQQKSYQNPYDNFNTDYSIQSALNDSDRSTLTAMADERGNPSVRSARLAQIAANAIAAKAPLYTQKYNQEQQLQNQKVVGQSQYLNQWEDVNRGLRKDFEHEVLQTREVQRQQKAMAIDNMMNIYLRKAEENQALKLSLMNTNWDWDKFKQELKNNPEKARAEFMRQQYIAKNSPTQNNYSMSSDYYIDNKGIPRKKPSKETEDNKGKYGLKVKKF